MTDREEQITAVPDSRDGVLDSKSDIVKFFTRNTNWEDQITIYREWKPTKDTIEYTLYFRAPLDGVSVKFRVDFDVYQPDLEDLGLEGVALEEALAFALKQAARATQVRQTDVYRKTGVLPARQAAFELGLVDS